MLQIITGLLALALGLWGLSLWWFSVQELLRGLLPVLLILLGAAALMAGVSRPAPRSDRPRSDQELIDELSNEPGS
ncbi:MAG: hypothetical protein H7842_01200 [Gammaproteobacteria bacterium SHHR-1]|uniref:hypothetical protein n=1 Tax=Magnetovirga frankeli TaxID=947516 RepID=UPI001293CD62|nr:hypothetical protein D5125_09100 [gamma proteobacterium SS-5]